MAKIMPAEVLNLGLSQNLLEPFSGIAGFRSIKSRAHIAETLEGLSERFQCGACHRVYLNMADLTVLASRDCNDTPLEIHVVPAKAVLFAAAHASVQGQIKLSLMFGVRLANLYPKLDFLFIV
jgi:hypothetical protein